MMKISEGQDSLSADSETVSHAKNSLTIVSESGEAKNRHKTIEVA